MISRLAKNITPSATCELEGVVADLKAQGIDVIEMNAGEPDFLTPHTIVHACEDAMAQGKMKYVNINGIAALREAICEKLKRDNQLIYDASQICVSTGAKQALFNAVLAVINPGDEVLIPIPGWVSYSEMVKMAGATPVYVKTKKFFHLDIEAIKAAVTDKTKAIMINSPNNPTGAVYTKDEIEALAELAKEHDFFVISDEVYEKYIYGGKKHYSIAAVSKDAYERTIVINGFSKAYAMTGWRIGYSAAVPEIARAITAIQGHVTSNSTTMVQWAAIEALASGEDNVPSMLAMYQERRTYMLGRLQAIPGVTCDEVDGAFYYMADFGSYMNKHLPDGEKVESAVRLCDYLLKEAHVAMVPGEAFLAPGMIRFAYTNAVDKIKIGMDRIEEALAKLQ